MKINVGLSLKSIEEAIEKLEKYQNKIEEAARIFTQKLAELGVQTIDTTIAGTPADPNASMEHMTEFYEVESSDDGVTFTIHLTGENVLFIEFGTGVHYNGPVGTSPHPKGAELGYTIGSYGLGQGANEYWWYTEDGQKIRTSGQAAACSIPAAVSVMTENIVNYAKDAWSMAD